MTTETSTRAKDRQLIRILIVDDDRRYRFLLRDEIRRQRRKLCLDEVGSGEAALAYCEDHNVDIVILDFDLGTMKGTQVLEGMEAIGLKKVAIGLTRFEGRVLTDMKRACAMAAFSKKNREAFLAFLCERIDNLVELKKDADDA